MPRLLLIRLRSLGDSILTLPLVEALHHWRPELELHILTEAPFAPVFSAHPAVHKTLVLKPRTKPTRMGWTRWKALREIRGQNYAAALNLHGGMTSLFFTLASGARFRIGRVGYRLPRAYNVLIPPSRDVWNRSDLHTVEHQLTILRWLNLPIPDNAVGTLYVERAAQDRIQARLRAGGIQSSNYFLIHPTATLFTKQWEEKKFAQLADWLLERYALPIIFTAAHHEAQTLLDIGEAARRNHFYWSDLELAELIALIDGCRLFIGNDGGPTHAASALRKPVVVVWGSSNFRAWHPWNTDYELIRSDLPCMPCPGYTCAAFGLPKCILEISVDRVLRACERILARLHEL